MNHPRRARLRRLLLLVPLALLGAVWLVWSRLPRPQTEGDKWLWEQAERGTALSISFGPREPAMQQQMGLNSSAAPHLLLKNRQGIRDVVRALESTPAFMPAGQSSALFSSNLWQLTFVVIDSRDGGETLWLTHEPEGYFLYRERSRLMAPISRQEFARFRDGLQRVVHKAKQRESGYYVAGEKGTSN